MAIRSVEFADVSFDAPGGRRLLSNISLKIEPGTTTALLGRSGSGKTTLLRTVNALVKPTSGRILVGDQDVATTDAIQLRRGIGYVIQESGLFPHMTIERNIRLPLDIGFAHGGHFDEAQKEVEGAMMQAGLSFAEFHDRYPWQLSGGQRQRVGLARALVSRPKVLLMDEPFGALDPLTRAEMQTMLRDLLRRVGVTTVLVTHDLDEALYLANNVVFLEGGRVVAQMPSAEVRSSPHPAVEAYVAATHRSDLP